PAAPPPNLPPLTPERNKCYCGLSLGAGAFPSASLASLSLAVAAVGLFSPDGFSFPSTSLLKRSPAFAGTSVPRLVGRSGHPVNPNTIVATRADFSDRMRNAFMRPLYARHANAAMGRRALPAPG